MQILSDIQPYNNPAKPVYKYRVWFSEDGLKRRHKVFKVKSTALDFINQAKAWNKGIDISSAESGEKQGISALITPPPALQIRPVQKNSIPHKKHRTLYGNTKHHARGTEKNIHPRVVKKCPNKSNPIFQISANNAKNSPAKSKCAFA